MASDSARRLPTLRVARSAARQGERGRAGAAPRSPLRAPRRSPHTQPPALCPHAPGCALRRQTKGRRRAGPEHRAHPAGGSGPAGPDSPCPPARPRGAGAALSPGRRPPCPCPAGQRRARRQGERARPRVTSRRPEPPPRRRDRRPYLPPPHRLSPRRPPASSAHGRAAILRLTNYCTSFGAGGRRPSRELPTPPGPSPRRRPRRPLASSRRLAAPGRPRGEDGQRRPCLCLPRRERGRSRSPPPRPSAADTRRRPVRARGGARQLSARLRPPRGLSASSSRGFPYVPGPALRGPEPPCHGRRGRDDPHSPVLWLEMELGHLSPAISVTSVLAPTEYFSAHRDYVRCRLLRK